jgi:hypothetical protein
MNSPGMQRIAAMMRPTQSQALMALASGLLSGPTFGAGLGKGLANLNGLSTQGRESYMQLANLGMQNAYRDALLGFKGVSADQAQQRIGQGDVRNQQGQQKIGQGDVRNQIAQERLTGQISGTTAGNQEAAREGTKAYTDLVGGAGADAATLAEINDAQRNLAAHPENYGPTAASRVRRVLSLAGFGDPADIQEQEKNAADVRMQYLRGVNNGHGGIPRSNAELLSIGKAMPTLDTDPKAANHIFDTLKAQIQARQAVRDAAMAQHGAPGWNAGDFPTWSAQQVESYYQQHPLPQYGTGPLAAPSGGSGQQPSIASFWR